ncbi:MAG: hypothetical protein Q9P01_07220 [Anaerolineae bacterium]|nr:hypothetical protein [Anaerolineae bacterium]MDQ7034616.1 hypothetical protein [Anaerolineae bacterium]
MEDDLNKQRTRWKLYDLERQGWGYLYNEQAQQAQKTFENGVKIAQANQMPCMELFFEYHICQVLVYYTYDQKAAVEPKSPFRGFISPHTK